MNIWVTLLYNSKGKYIFFPHFSFLEGNIVDQYDTLNPLYNIICKCDGKLQRIEVKFFMVMPYQTVRGIPCFLVKIMHFWQ